MSSGSGFREAVPADLLDLLDLEREANLAALGHVFPAERYPFPDDDVLARWGLLMVEPGVRVLVQDAGAGAAAPSTGLTALAAYDDTTLRHLAVHPAHWRRGLATELICRALRAMRDRGTVEAQLWCLEENRRARRLYESLGWRAAADRREAVFPPYPTEMRYTRAIPASRP